MKFFFNHVCSTLLCSILRVDQPSIFIFSKLISDKGETKAKRCHLKFKEIGNKNWCEIEKYQSHIGKLEELKLLYIAQVWAFELGLKRYQ